MTKNIDYINDFAEQLTDTNTFMMLVPTAIAIYPKYTPVFFFSSIRRHTRWPHDWSSDVCSSDLKKRKRISKDKWTAVAFLLPSLILILVFVYGFIGWTGYVSLSNYNTIVPDFSFAGLKNYKYLFSDFRFQADLRNTLFYNILFIGLVIIMGLGIAVIIDQKLNGESLFRNIFLFPMALSFIVPGVVWQWLLNPSTGLINS